MASQAKTTRRQRSPLTRERVLRKAIQMADEGGIESLSMRRLASALGVEAMSLYNHVANKADLVDAMVDAVLAEIELPDDGEWDAAIRTCAVSAHEAFLRHPWACNLVMSPRSRPTLESNRLRYMEWLLRRLREGGFSADLTYHAYHALDSHIIGFTIWALGHAAGAATFAGGEEIADVARRFIADFRAGELTYLAEHAEQHMAAPPGDTKREFEFGLDLILDGLKRADP
jgi:AcrR family transcriptional regulator